jgi:hypothetical protein
VRRCRDDLTETASRSAVAGAGWQETGRDVGRTDYEREIFRLALVVGRA